MKIVKLTAENVKKLKVVEITPDGSLVQVTGPNGSGKSSVLDSIFYALAGTSVVPSKVVRDGEEKAHVRLDLGEIVVTRRFTSSGGASLTVEAANGARFPSPQKMLDSIVGSLAFDPLAFARMEPKQQLESLRKIVRLDVDIDALDAEAKQAFDSRTATNRQIRALESRIAALPPIAADVPDEPVDFAALLGDLDAAEKTNAEIETERHRREGLSESVSAWRSEAQKLRQQADELLHRVDGLVTSAATTEAELAALRPLPSLTDTADIKAQMAHAQGINANVAEKKKRAELGAELAQLREAESKLTETIKSTRGSRDEAIARAEMPVPGLSFGDGEVVYNGLPLSVASDAERLRVSVAIAMAANPKLRVLRVKDGSLLDEDSLNGLAEMAELADYQIWVERVDTSGFVGIVMSDGQLA